MANLRFRIYGGMHTGVYRLTVGRLYVKLVQVLMWLLTTFFFSSGRRHTRSTRDWSSDVCSSDLHHVEAAGVRRAEQATAVEAGVAEEVGRRPLVGEADGVLVPAAGVALVVVGLRLPQLSEVEA